MKGIGGEFGPEIALEDCQTFFLTEAERSRYPGVPLGHPVWGERHCTMPASDPGNTDYRRCCTANAWVGAVLSAHILGARELWNHQPLFDYQDRYMSEEQPGSWERSLSDFAEAMWDAYRASYGPVWSGDGPGPGRRCAIIRAEAAEPTPSASHVAAVLRARRGGRRRCPPLEPAIPSAGPS
jgi:hypothetical protein